MLGFKRKRTNLHEKYDHPELKASAITGKNGEYIGPMVTLALITKQVEAEQRVLQLAHHDALTVC